MMSVEFRHGFEHFPADGALAGYDERIVKGMHEDETVLRAIRMRKAGWILQRRAFQDHARAPALGVLGFDRMACPSASRSSPECRAARRDTKRPCA